MITLLKHIVIRIKYCFENFYIKSMFTAKEYVTALTDKHILSEAKISAIYLDRPLKDIQLCLYADYNKLEEDTKELADYLGLQFNK